MGCRRRIGLLFSPPLGDFPPAKIGNKIPAAVHAPGSPGLAGFRNHPGASPASETMNDLQRRQVEETQYREIHAKQAWARANAEEVGKITHYSIESAKCVCVCSYTTCIRLLFRPDTDDLTGGVRRGKGAMVTSHTCLAK